MTRLARALSELDAAMGGRPYILVYDQAHKSRGRACIKGTFAGGYVAAMGLAHVAPQFLGQLGGGDVKCDEGEPAS